VFVRWYDVQMLKYFDNTFFRFLFGFLGILFFSLVVLVVTQYFGKDDAGQNEVDTEMIVSQV
jgi:hypothetical protein